MSEQTTPTPRASATEASEPAPLGRGAWWTVARREMFVKLTDKSFLVSTFLMVALIAGFVVLQSILADGTTTARVATTQADRAAVSTFAPLIEKVDDKVKVTVQEVPDAAAAEKALRDGSADAWLHHGDGGWTLTAKSDVDSSLAAATTAVVRQSVIAQNASAAGTTPEAIEAGSLLQTSVLEGSAEQQLVGQVIGIVLAFLFFMASTLFGTTLAMSAVEEKASRIVEIITTKIPVRHLLAGKVVGNSLLAIAQMALFSGIGLIGLGATPYRQYLPAMTAAIAWFIVFFIVGFLLLACLWAVAGALASRTEDVQSTAMPLSMTMMVIWFSAFLAKGSVLTVLSFIPPFSPVLMPMRLAQGEVPWWQPVLALLLLIAAAVLVIRAAERLYRRSLLQTQGKLSVRQAWQTEE